VNLFNTHKDLLKKGYSNKRLKKIENNNSESIKKHSILNSIYLLSKELNISIIEAILEYCNRSEIDVEDISDILLYDKMFLGKIKKEAQDLHYIDKSNITNLI